MNKGLTIIIPCYNVEKYITKCLDSIVNQNIKKYEIILVNDCSKDKTSEVIKEYISTHDKMDITLIENEVNSGAGCSRNKAVAISKYDIISFIDSDDYIDDNFYSSMLSKMEKDKSDVVVCDINIIEGDSKLRVAALEGKYINFNYINNGLAASPCNKLFKKELLVKFPFAEGIMNEDIPTVISSLVYAKKISYVDDTCYNYIQHDFSVQNKKFSEKRFDIFKAMGILNNRIKDCDDYEEIWDAVVYNQLITFFLFVFPKEKNVFKRAKYLKKYYRLAKIYRIRKNHYLWDFLAAQGTKHRIYYKLLLKLNDSGFSFLTSLVIWLYDVYKFIFVRPVIKKELTIDDLIREAKKQQSKTSNTTVSVVIPNYNYEKFMIQRLYSILYQTYKVNEIIILDDCSTDNSRELIDEIESKLKDYITIKKFYNQRNSNCVFKQWQKGFKQATSDYVWIAEADDYSNKKFLNENMKQINKDKDIVISYTDTAFIDINGKIIARSVTPSIDIQESGHWNNDFVVDGIEEIKNHAYLNCTIANVSSVIFKNGNYDDVFKKAAEFKQAGDWRFYLGMFEHGKVSYRKKRFNYYRIHGSNVTSTSKKKMHFAEIKKIHGELDKKIKFTKEQKERIKERYKFLSDTWHLDND